MLSICRVSSSTDVDDRGRANHNYKIVPEKVTFSPRKPNEKPKPRIFNKSDSKTDFCTLKKCILANRCILLWNWRQVVCGVDSGVKKCGPKRVFKHKGRIYPRHCLVMEDGFSVVTNKRAKNKQKRGQSDSKPKRAWSSTQTNYRSQKSDPKD